MAKELGDLVTSVLIPVKDKIGIDMLKGNSSAIISLKRQMKIPNGTHMNAANVSNGVALKANLPSWKINGFGYFSLGRVFQFCFSASLTK